MCHVRAKFITFGVLSDECMPKRIWLIREFKCYFDVILIMQRDVGYAMYLNRIKIQMQLFA